MLLAEDNVVNQKVAAGMLLRLGFGADVASNGLEALDKCKRWPYDLLFMDWHMPGLDGYDAAGELRRREAGALRTTIIALTADAREGTRERCLKAGMDDYIVKPVRLEDLRQALQKWAPTAS